MGNKHNKELILYGSFFVVDPIGLVTYNLSLPEDSKLHFVFLVSFLKKFHARQLAFPDVLFLTFPQLGIPIPTP